MDEGLSAPDGRFRAALAARRARSRKCQRSRFRKARRRLPDSLPARFKEPSFEPTEAVLTGEWSNSHQSQEMARIRFPVPSGPGHLIATKASPEFILSEYGSQTLDGRAQSGTSA